MLELLDVHDSCLTIILWTQDKEKAAKKKAAAAATGRDRSVSTGSEEDEHAVEEVSVIETLH